MIRLVGMEGNVYSIHINEKRTPLSVELNNLKVTRLLVNYHKEFNDLFYGFLNELLGCFFPGKIVNSLKRNEIAALKTRDNFFLMLLQRGKKTSETYEEHELKKAHELTDRIQNLLSSFCRDQFEYFDCFASIPVQYQESLLYQSILNCRCYDKIAEVVGSIQVISVRDGNQCEIITGWFYSCLDFKIEVDLFFPCGIGNNLSQCTKGEFNYMKIERLKTNLAL